MSHIHQDRTPQQILDYYPHPIPQPDSEEARQARVGQRFRLEFLLDAERTVATLGKKPASQHRRDEALLARCQVQIGKALMDEPQNAFLAKDHARHVAWLLAELRAMID